MGWVGSASADAFRVVGRDASAEADPTRSISAFTQLTFSQMRHRLIPALVLFALPASAFAQRRPAQPPPPPVTSSLPQAAAPGKTTEVTFGGVEFGAAEGIWTSFAAEAERVRDAKGGGVTYRLTL